MTLATGIGSMPGDDARDFDEAVRVVLGEVSGLPHLPELPERGAGGHMTGRGLAIAEGLGADVQPAGWRLTDAAGADLRRARSLLAQDLDVFEEQTQGYAGPLKIQVVGPWTLAATVEKPRGDKVLSDHGARRDLAQSLAEGVRSHVADVRRRVGGADRLIVQVDEPALGAVLTGGVPTASGFGRHRTVHPPEASAALEWVLDAITESGGEPWVHACAPGTPLDLLRGAGARGLAVDLDTITAAGHDQLGEAIEAGEIVALGVVPTLEPDSPPTDSAVVDRVLRWLDMLGIDPAGVGDQLVITPACGLAGASPSWARQALQTCQLSATHLT
ncbi:methionine synthase [Nocardioides sp. InS609-2]|uniref:methionine synthase n=1 Tax=Nocardioides sp. InS609-2 TaxID=2760705 RepID=UPI0020BE2D7B|nr:methionine synthase [Nocardioides sp. InS609-2]